jgi:hypothetical protein
VRQALTDALVFLSSTDAVWLILLLLSDHIVRRSTPPAWRAR